MPKIALITGIAGQDGSYLTKLLLGKGYVVHGLTKEESSHLWRHDYLGTYGKCHLHTIDLTDKGSVKTIIATIKPDEVYHLAAQSSVANSIKDPLPTLRFNTLSTLSLLEACTWANADIRLFHASSSEIFDQLANSPLSLRSPIRPSTPYGASKAAAHLLTQSSRSHGNLFAVNGVLFPHESPLRHPDAFTKSLIRQAVAIKQGEANTILLGQIENARDFGSAEEFVYAIWQSLQAETAQDYIIGTGTPTTIRDIAYYVLDSLGLDRTIIQGQTGDVSSIFADTTETETLLGFKASATIYKTIDEMIRFESEYPNQTKDT